MIPEDVRKTIRLAVTLHRNISECALSLGYDDADIVKFQRAAEDSDRALAWLDALPQAPEPDWDAAPEWARWATLFFNRAYAASGRMALYWQFHEGEPIRDEISWMTPKGTKSLIGSQRVEIPLGIDWRTTLRQRPEA